MAWSTDPDELGGTVELRTTGTSSNDNLKHDISDGGDVEIADKIPEAYNQYAMQGADRKNASFQGARKHGLRRLASYADDDFEPRDGSVNATAEIIENAGGTAGEGDEGSGTVYRVYKRRWLGLAQLTLLNLVVSWDVSLASYFAASFSGEPVLPWRCAFANTPRHMNGRATPQPRDVQPL